MLLTNVASIDGAARNAQPLTVLVLCTGNSARSIMAEAIINDICGHQVSAFSAGSKPTGKVNPLALEQIGQAGLSIEGLRSKSWLEFSGPDAFPLDLVITVCDNAANEPCPVFQGDAIKVHWPLPDPAAVTGTDTERQDAFAAVFSELAARAKALDGLLRVKTEKKGLIAELRRLGLARNDI